MTTPDWFDPLNGGPLRWLQFFVTVVFVIVPGDVFFIFVGALQTELVRRSDLQARKCLRRCPFGMSLPDFTVALSKLL